MNRATPAPVPDGLTSLRDYLIGACAEEPELLATVLALAEAGEVELLHVVRDFRDNLSDGEFRRKYAAGLDDKLRLIHRVYVESTQAVRRRTQRPLQARKCYESRMLGRRDNYQAMLADKGAIPAAERSAVETIIACARDKVAYEDLPARLGRELTDIEDEILRLRTRFKDWAAARK